MKAGAPVGRLLEGQRRRDEIDLESPLAKPDRARLLEPAAFGFFTQLEAGLDGLMDQGFGLGGGDKDDGIRVSRRGSPTTMTARPPTTRVRIPRSSRNAKANRQKVSNSLGATVIVTSFESRVRFDPQSDREASGVVVVRKLSQTHDLGGKEGLTQGD